MDDTSGSWAAYVTHAIEQAGSVAELARRAGLHRSTIFEWRAGRGADTIRMSSVYAVADAIGDDRRNALNAAGGSVAADEEKPGGGSGEEAPTLADLLRAVRESGAPLKDQLNAAAEVISMYRQGRAGDDQRKNRPA